jgi:translation initiation factor 2 alpha subunit (eIF-2alpha)
MSEESSKQAETTGAEQSQFEARQAWEEVGQQFEQLGKSLAAAFSALWQNQETQEHVESVKSGLQSLADEISAAVNKTTVTPEAEKVKADAQKAAESARKAVEKAAEEARPQIASALKQVNTELQKLIDRMEAEENTD